MNYGEDIPRLTEYERLSQLIDYVLEAIDFIASNPERWRNALFTVERRPEHTGKFWAIDTVWRRVTHGGPFARDNTLEQRLTTLQRIVNELERQRSLVPATDQSPMPSSTMMSR